MCMWLSPSCTFFSNYNFLTYFLETRVINIYPPRTECLCSAVSQPSNYKLIYPLLFFAGRSSNEQCTSLRLKFAEGKKWHVWGVSLGLSFLRGALEQAECLGRQQGECDEWLTPRSFTVCKGQQPPVQGSSPGLLPLTCSTWLLGHQLLN